MADLCEGDNEPPGSLKAISEKVLTQYVSTGLSSEEIELALNILKAANFLIIWHSLRRSEDKRLEEFDIWIMEKNGAYEMDRQNKKSNCAIKTECRKNNTETYNEKENKLTGSLVKKKLSTEGCTGRNEGLRAEEVVYKCLDDLITHLNKLTRSTRGDESDLESAAVKDEHHLYGCETLALTLTEEQRLRVFENKVLRKIFGAKRNEVTGEWRKLHDVELHALYSSPDIIRNIKSRRLKWAGHVAHMDESRNAYRVTHFSTRGLSAPTQTTEQRLKFSDPSVVLMTLLLPEDAIVQQHVCCV
ncbi:hypothetical protein ANN_27088 [Periplaneta americana]|uniref:Uncharacterized protein n=1 Tax=Periplaneta americana TaxID=6978 RepID=A0ABQ8RX34_PERAM|nr:hypothetical protein ANN_27088 [Periplaneta americana]